MKILLVTHYYPRHRGGVEIVAGELAKHLTREYGTEIEWFASDVDPAPAEAAGMHCVPMRTLNFAEKFLGIPYPLWGLTSLNRLRKAIRERDILHLHEYLYMGNIIAFLLARIYKKPVVLTQHIGYIPYKNFIFRMLLSFLNRTLGRFILGRTDQVIFFSDVVQNYFSKRTSFRRPPVLIPNGVDHEIFFAVDEQRRAEIRRQLKLSREKPLFLFVGRFVEKKGLHILKRLVLRFGTVHWIFAGWGELDPERWGLSNVSVFHNLSGSELAPLYQTADLLVLPSKGEGFPLVIQEAMACGTPVMVGSETAKACSQTSPLMFSEDVKGENAAERWSSKIEEILNNRGRLLELRGRVVEFAVRHWRWPETAKSYYKIFSDLVG